MAHTPAAARRPFRGWSSSAAERQVRSSRGARAARITPYRRRDRGAQRQYQVSTALPGSDLPRHRTPRPRVSDPPATATTLGAVSEGLAAFGDELSCLRPRDERLSRLSPPGSPDRRRARAGDRARSARLFSTGFWRRRGRSPARATRRSGCSTSGAPSSSGSSRSGIDEQTRAAIGDLPRGRGVLGVLIDRAAAAAPDRRRRASAQLRVPGRSPADAQLPRRADRDPRRGVGQPLPDREAGRRVHRGRRGGGGGPRRLGGDGDRERAPVRAQRAPPRSSSSAPCAGSRRHATSRSRSAARPGSSACSS